MSAPAPSKRRPCPTLPCHSLASLSFAATTESRPPWRPYGASTAGPRLTGRIALHAAAWRYGAKRFLERICRLWRLDATRKTAYPSAPPLLHPSFSTYHRPTTFPSSGITRADAY